LYHIVLDRRWTYINFGRLLVGVEFARSDNAKAVHPPLKSEEKILVVIVGGRGNGSVLGHTIVRTAA
jgi:hypothetical protein